MALQNRGTFLFHVVVLARERMSIFFMLIRYLTILGTTLFCSTMEGAHVALSRDGL